MNGNDHHQQHARARTSALALASRAWPALSAEFLQLPKAGMRVAVLLAIAAGSNGFGADGKSVALNILASVIVMIVEGLWSALKPNHQRRLLSSTASELRGLMDLLPGIDKKVLATIRGNKNLKAADVDVLLLSTSQAGTRIAMLIARIEERLVDDQIELDERSKP